MMVADLEFANSRVANVERRNVSYFVVYCKGFLSIPAVRKSSGPNWKLCAVELKVLTGASKGHSRHFCRLTSHQYQ